MSQVRGGGGGGGGRERHDFMPLIHTFRFLQLIIHKFHTN